MYLISSLKSFKRSCLKDLILELRGRKKNTYYLMSIILFSHGFINMSTRAR